MSHTNSTTNYSLPQFVGTDKPTWLNDVNGAFSAIDTQMKANADSATSAGTSATTANTSIGTLSNLNTTTKTDLVSAVNEVNTNLGTVSGVASGASSTATQAKNTADALAEFITLTTFEQKTAVFQSGTGNFSYNDFNCATNADGTYGKLYGWIQFNFSSASGGTIKIPTNFRPTSNINLMGVALIQNQANNLVEPYMIHMATNGDVTIDFDSYFYNKTVRVMFLATPIYATDFGD